MKIAGAVKVAGVVLFAAIAAAQDQTGSVSGVVLDAVSHQPVRKATVSLNLMGGMGARTQNAGPQSAITDVAGSFSINNLAPGQYQLVIHQQSYPQARNGEVRKSIEVKAGEKAGPVNLELIPGAAVTGHVVDEDGDPLNGCMVEARNLPNSNRGFGQTAPVSIEDGAFRLSGFPAGKYILAARCQQPAFQARPFSPGPDTPPSMAYPMQFYPATSEAKSAEVVDLAPGSEKAGIEFRMRPAAVTQIHGTFAAGGADWHDRTNLMVQLAPMDEKDQRSFPARPVLDIAKGTFEFRQVFPGSYMLIAFTNGSAENRIGAMQRVDVKDKPVEAAVSLRPAIEIEGTIQIEGNNSSSPLTPVQCSVQLSTEYLQGMPPGSNAQVKEDGSFVLRSVLPGLWRLHMQMPNGFLKSAWMGTTEVTNGLDLLAGAAGALKLVVSTNTATIRGTGPAGQMVFAQTVGEPLFNFNRAFQVDQSGQFRLDGLAPGKYRLGATETGSPPPEEGGQEITVHEGETLTIDVKARSN